MQWLPAKPATAIIVIKVLGVHALIAMTVTTVMPERLDSSVGVATAPTVGCYGCLITTARQSSAWEARTPNWPATAATAMRVGSGKRGSVAHAMPEMTATADNLECNVGIATTAILSEM